MMLYLHPLTDNWLVRDLVAQLVEHLPFKERVLGSRPSQITKFVFLNTSLFTFLEQKNP